MKLKTTIYGKQATMIGSPGEISALLDNVRRTARQRATDSLPQVAEQAKLDADERVVPKPAAPVKTVHVKDVFKTQFTPTFEPITQSREEIVKEAIADVAELLDISFYSGEVKAHVGASVDFTIPTNDRVDFFINKEKRSVVAKLWLTSVGTAENILPNAYATTGIARCAPSDVFNEHVGKAIALRRALGLEVPAKYYEVGGIAPEGKQVGDVVRGPSYADDSLHRKTIVSGWVGENECGPTSIFSRRAKVIDDSARYVAPSTPAAKVVYHG